MKVLKWMLIIVLAVGAGAWIAESRQRQNSDDAVAAQEDGTELSTQSDNAAERATDVAVTAPVVEEVVVPALEPIAYQPSTNEKNALTLLGKFYEAYNLADAQKLTSCFDLSVPVTQVISSSLAASQPRPTKIKIKSIETRSDSSQVAHITEDRSNNQSYEQEIELIPTSSGLLVVAYRRVGNSGLVSGF